MPLKLFRSSPLDGCAMCTSVSRPQAVWDKPLFESLSFVAIPSLGSLVEGWLLIVPRAHFVSTGVLPDAYDRELADFKCDVTKRLESTYGPISAFEHGAFTAGRQVGCGVDHAHVHLVPIEFDLCEASRPYLPEAVEWQEATWLDCKRASAAQLEYLYVEQPFASPKIAIAPRLGSQLLRRAIADRLQRPSEYDWRSHPQSTTVINTIRNLSLQLVKA